MGTNQEALAVLRKKLESRYKETAELYPDFSKPRQIEVIPTGSMILNLVTGVGGLPRGRVTEIHGDYSTGKTTIAAETIAALQKADQTAVTLFVDYEHAFDLVYAKKLGVGLHPDRFIIVQPDSFEQGHVIIDEYVTAGVVDLVIIDSAAAMTPQAELEGEVDEQGRIGLQASLMSKLLTRVTKQITGGKRPAVLILNQTRSNIDMKNPRLSGGDKPAGGAALKFYTTIRILLELVKKEGDSKRATDKAGTDQIYTRSRIRVTAIKNKVAPPFMRGELIIDYGRGTNNLETIADLAEAKLKIMSGSGFVTYKGDSPETSFSLRGRDALRAHIAANPKIALELEKKVMAAISEENRRLLEMNPVEGVGVTESESEGKMTILEA